MGWVYLAVILDLHSRRVIVWAMSANPDHHVPLRALHMALAHRHPQPGLIHHTDQGALSTSVANQRLLAQRGMAPSMSRRSNCFYNAVVESFFSVLKNELVHDQDFLSREEAQVAVFEFLELFYNRQRLHQTLGCLSPLRFEAALLSGVTSHHYTSNSGTLD
jgi:transposase InsO family protein